jgi:hypothetical protein
MGALDMMRLLLLVMSAKSEQKAIGVAPASRLLRGQQIATNHKIQGAQVSNISYILYMIFINGTGWTRA